MAMQQMLFEEGVKYVPGSQSFGPGSNVFSVPLYHTLIVELWGGGASGGGIQTFVNGSGSTLIAGVSGTQSQVPGGGLFAYGGSAPVNTSNNPSYTPAGGGASGGDINTAGGNGVSGGYGLFKNASLACGFGGGGGSSPNGGNGAPTQPDVQVDGARAGTNGGSPGGGGSGCSHNYNLLTQVAYTSGGGAGGYCKKTYTAGAPGAPNYNDIVSLLVGSGGNAAGADTSSGAGANGLIRFTWT